MSVPMLRMLDVALTDLPLSQNLDLQTLVAVITAHQCGRNVKCTHSPSLRNGIEMPHSPLLQREDQRHSVAKVAEKGT